MMEDFRSNMQATGDDRAREHAAANIYTADVNAAANIYTADVDATANIYTADVDATADANEEIRR